MYAYIYGKLLEQHDMNKVGAGKKIFLENIHII
jgi:hypothetical protein